MNGPRNGNRVQISEELRQTLTFSLGFATGAAFARGDNKIAYGFMRAANELNRDNPHWTPYEIPVIEPDYGNSPSHNPEAQSH